MVSVDLREFGASGFFVFFGREKNTFLQSFFWLGGTKISALRLGPKKIWICNFLDDFCVLLQQPKLIMTDL